MMGRDVHDLTMGWVVLAQSHTRAERMNNRKQARKSEVRVREETV